MHVTQETLKSFTPKHQFFVGFDSDGCVFDSMEIKHKECFCPQFINHFELQPVAKYARETWDFVNLYSRMRGCNRFLAVIYALDIIRERKEVKDRHVQIMQLDHLREWIKRETRLGNPVLKKEVEKTQDPELNLAYEYSVDVNNTVKKIVRHVPPFPYVQEILQRLKSSADVIVVSQTPSETLIREWEDYAIAQYVEIICGQEQGTKTEHIHLTAEGKYPKNHVLMVGDAPGDLQAAKDNHALFFPINPGDEEASWERLHQEALDRFFSESYSGAYEESLIKEFERILPETPPWKTGL